MKLLNILLEFIIDNKKSFLISFIFTNIFILTIYFIVDREFESRAKILPSEQSNNVINLSSFGSFFPTAVLKDPRGGQIFSSIIKSQNFYYDLSQEAVMTGGESKTIHNFLLEYYDLKEKEKVGRNKKTTHNFLLDSYDLANKNKNIELSKAHKLFISKLVSVRHDQVTGIVSISIFTKEPMLSQLLAELTIKTLENRLVKYNVESKEANKNFISNRINEVEKNLRDLEGEYIKFLDSNQNSSSPFFKMEKIRLERQMDGKESLLSRLYSELEVNLSEQLRENQTFLDIIEKPTLNESKVYPKLSNALILSLLISFSIPLVLRFKKWQN
ncbi:hypothetical protein OAP62_00620 [Candidatus Marinimicrobia bacterium]|nr:hypothetical protein [Candidatus Neomarinimicrobiota bacterium]